MKMMIDFLRGVTDGMFAIVNDGKAFVEFVVVVTLFLLIIILLTL